MSALPPLKPMLALPGKVPESGEYLYEVKWDGFRCLAYVDGATRLLSRRGRSLTQAFPELGGLERLLPKGQPLILDGELIILEDGRPAISRLQERLAAGRPRPGAPEARLVAFDLLYLEGRPLLDLPLTARRARLEALLGSLPASGRLELSPVLAGAGPALFQAVRAHGLEGLMAKRRASPYRPGRRSPDWLKIRARPTREAVVLGYTVRGDQVRSLALGLPHQGGWRYAGHVASGLSPKLGRILRPLLERLRTPQPPVPLPLPRGRIFSPPAEAETLWVRPVLVVEVEYLELTRTGLFRHASLKGFRPDKSPQEVGQDG
ncbi:MULTISPECIES: non-homologous end-joining DNA ligase [Limnochorda]|uniref:non-homologous end-joining DNA ligase n=1 Tax=Limnochorda TaxID=1676651 RepID=UPI001E0CED7C|nr:non-homologous end-joining DNA ligase [Limnochorda pilosa]MBO2487096.1 ATP-dependent DNA ligase [Bacillota bacterium]MBO2519888.1 ATP-dependent DNA ligase [Bacillota bacterium]